MKITNKGTATARKEKLALAKREKAQVERLNAKYKGFSKRGNGIVSSGTQYKLNLNHWDMNSIQHLL